MAILGRWNQIHMQMHIRMAWQWFEPWDQKKIHKFRTTALTTKPSYYIIWNRKWLIIKKYMASTPFMLSHHQYRKLWMSGHQWTSYLFIFAKAFWIRQGKKYPANPPEELQVYCYNNWAFQRLGKGSCSIQTTLTLRIFLHMTCLRFHMP
jgi:hypothetical protein